MERDQQIEAFLQSSGWNSARREVLAADASFRRYERVYHQGKQAVLMDAPPAKEDVRPFIQVANLLTNMGLHAPRIHAEDSASGLLLLEDMGDALFTRVLNEQPALEKTLYESAADVLVSLHQKSSTSDFSSLRAYDERMLLAECSLFGEWFLPTVITSERVVGAAAEFLLLWQSLLAKRPSLSPTLVLRDFHADNLIWLPEYSGLARVGLLDFQDAVVGSPAYDMVSFLQDARRDVDTQTVHHVLQRYLARVELSQEVFMADYALLGAQRQCKIIGIFHRLATRDGKTQYLSYLPRVWKHLLTCLEHPSLEPLQSWMQPLMPQELRRAG